MKSSNYPFISDAGRIINSGQSRTLLLTGNTTDIFYSDGGNRLSGDYVPLTELLVDLWSVKGNLIVIYELNGPIRFLSDEDEQKMCDAWGKLHDDGTQHAIDLALARTKRRVAELKKEPRYSFKEKLKKAEGNPTYALELLRQMCLCSRLSHEGVPFLWEDLVIVIEAADFLIPEGSINSLKDVDRQRVAICRDWFSDPGFTEARDTVLLVAESASLLNSKLTKLPQVLEVEVPSPLQEERLHLIEWFIASLSENENLQLWSTPEVLAKMTAGLSSHALVQLLRFAVHKPGELTSTDVVAKVEQYIKDLLGDDVVEFKKPTHGMNDVVGFSKLKEFLNDEFIPRIQTEGKAALSGAVIGGPIGAGKTFLLEAVAGELGIVVLVLKNLRSKWFGSTDVIFERLRRIIHSLDKSLIFVDEADTQFGGVGAETHDTERRLTGKIQAMMSDPSLKGKTSWLLITARIHLLSPDLRRPGRAGSLMIPILDPQGDDLNAFIEWMIKPVYQIEDTISESTIKELKPLLEGYYAAVYAEIRSNLIAVAERKKVTYLDLEEIISIIEDYIPPSLKDTRRYQALQALLGCTRLSLLPPNINRENLNDFRERWSQEISSLEMKGVS